MKCPNCSSANLTEYVHEGSRRYAFTICEECGEEFTDERHEDDGD